jgi:hypothetical protein
MGIEVRPTQPKQEAALVRTIVRRASAVKSALVLVNGILMPAESAKH